MGQNLLLLYQDLSLYIDILIICNIIQLVSLSQDTQWTLQEPSE